MFNRIYQGLDSMTLSGTQAQDAAKLGFLEWVFSLEDSRGAAVAARSALDGLGGSSSHSRAAQLFLAYVQQAADTKENRPVRKGGRRRMLN